MGIISSVLCLLHCALTPLLFISQPTILNSYTDFAEIWWSLASLFIIPVSLYAVYRSNRNTTNRSLGTICGCCFILLATIINEAFEIFSLKNISVMEHQSHLVFACINLNIVLVRMMIVAPINNAYFFNRFLGSLHMV